MAIPSTPQNLYVQQGNGQVYLSWDSSAGATSYPVERSTDNITFTQVSNAAAVDYLDTSVTVGTVYYYRVSAYNTSGTSSPTEVQSIVPTQPGQMTLGQIRTMAQQRADRVNSNFVTKPEWNSYINQSYFELYDLLVTTYEDYYIAPAYQFITDGSNAIYNLPDGSSSFTDVNGNVCKPFYKLMGLDCGIAANNNAWVTLNKFPFISRNRYVYPNVTSTFFGVFNMQYRLMGNSIHFIPTPSAGQYMQAWYIPRVATLLKDSDILDGISGWTEYVIVDAAIKALEKEESDASLLVAQKMALKQRIEETAMNRDAGQPDTISNTRSFSGRNGGGQGGFGFDGSWGGT